LVTYGLNSGTDWRAFDLSPNGRGGYDFSVSTNLLVSQSSNLPILRAEPQDEAFHVSTSVPGTHNVKNGLAALIVAHALDVPLDQATAALADFKGVGRRFEVKGQAGGVTVIDDYAHHPTEIRATLAAARASYPGRSVWAMFQPHTYSRTRALLDDFATAFGNADHVLIVDIFPAREADDGSVTSRDILARMKHPDARYVGSLKDAADYLADHLGPGDLLITLGAGDGYRVGELVIQKVGSREYSA